MSSSTVSHHAREVTRTRAFEVFARAGYVARGVLYLVIGILALRLAWGVSQEAVNQQGALKEISDQPAGLALLLVMIIGLAGYSAFRLTMATFGQTPEAGRHSAMDRIGALGSGIAYALFAVSAIGLLTGDSGSTSGDGQAQRTTAGVFDWPGGRFLVGAAGVILLVVAAYQASQSVTRKFLDDTKTGEMGPGLLKAFTVLGVAGLGARAVAFGLMGGWVLNAAIEFNAREAVGLDGALARLTQHHYGTAALVAVAVGFAMFAGYSIVDARHRKI
ncbi:MAG: DUF1206 domain-containing protein [Thermoleophilia bacterium]